MKQYQSKLRNGALILALSTSAHANNLGEPPLKENGDVNLVGIQKELPYALAHKVLERDSVGIEGKFVMNDGKKRKGTQYVIEGPYLGSQQGGFYQFGHSPFIRLHQLVYTDVDPEGPSPNDEIQYTFSIKKLKRNSTNELMRDESRNYVMLADPFKPYVTQLDVIGKQSTTIRYKTPEAEEWKLRRWRSIEGQWDTTQISEHIDNLVLVSNVLDAEKEYLEQASK